MPLDDSPCAAIPDVKSPIRTVADALDRLCTLPDLDPAKTRRCCSALTSACRLLDRPADHLGFTKAALIGPTKALHPARCGLSRKRLQNLVCDLQMVFRLLLAPQIADTERQETLVRDSGLDWVLVQPVNLTDALVDTPAHASADGDTQGMKVARRQVGRFLAGAVAGPAWLHRAVALSAA